MLSVAYPINELLVYFKSRCLSSLIPDRWVAMTSEEEEGPSVATSTATTPSAAAISRVTTAIARGDSSDDAVTSSSPRRPSPYHLPCPEEKEEKEEEIEEEGIIQEERIEKEEEEEVVECERDDEDDEDDGSSDTSVLVVPYPELVPVVFFCLKQTTCPRSWCIRMVSSPYPFYTVNNESLSLLFQKCLSVLIHHHLIIQHPSLKNIEKAIISLKIFLLVGDGFSCESTQTLALDVSPHRTNSQPLFPTLISI